MGLGHGRFCRLHLNEWTGKDGERRSRIQVVADAVQFLAAPKGDKAADDKAGERRKAS